METVRLVVTPRDGFGKGPARRLRAVGQVPAVLYGNGDTVAVAVAALDLRAIEKSEAGENSLLEVSFGNEGGFTCHAIMREVQIDPVSRQPLHVDLYRLDMTKPISVTVPLEFVNEPVDLLVQADVVLNLVLREIEVECLPQNIPDAIQVDLEALQIGEALKASEIVLPAGITLLTDDEETIVTTSAAAQVEAEVEDTGAETDAESTPETTAPTS